MTSKEEMIDKIQEILLEQGRILQDDKEMNLEDKLHKTDVVLNTFKFLNDYDENIEILNRHLIEKKTEQLKSLDRIKLAQDNLQRRSEECWSK